MVGALAVVVALLVAIRIALPTALERYANHALQNLEDYDGSIADVDLALWRGAARIEGLNVAKRGAGRTLPFFSADAIEFSLEWRNVLRGALVAEGVFHAPVVNLVQAKTDEESQLGAEVDWTARLSELFPIRINTVRVIDGRVTFTAPGIDAKDALTAEDVDVEVRNLTNVVDSGEETFARFVASARVLGGAPLKMKGRIDPLARLPTFDVNLALEGVQLPEINPWLRQYAKADAESGTFQLYLELAAADGKFKGYAKPLAQNVNILSAEEKEKNPFKRLWEGVVDFAVNIFENDEEEQVAARAPFSGTIQNPDAGILQTIVSVLTNAFVSAFAHSLEGSISLEDVTGDVKLAEGEQKQKEQSKEKELERRKKRDEQEEAAREKK